MSLKNIIVREENRLTLRAPANSARVRRWCIYLIIHATVVALSAVGFYQDFHQFFYQDLTSRPDGGNALFTAFAAAFLPMAFVGPLVTWKMRRAAKNSLSLGLLSVLDLGLDLAHWMCLYTAIL